MTIWEKGKRGRRFLPGREAPDIAAMTAEQCGAFARDYEEECFAEQEVTCYNCRYRRWTRDSFECMRPEVTA
ncbi:MAG: hypothetical protein IKR95_00395 [Oscillospiraceae bacterium]|nr:hypothetical protein [Oscillospiraceae bacterium]